MRINKPAQRTSASLATANLKELCRVRRDNFGLRNFSIMTDGSNTVWLSEQKMGEPQKQHIQIPRRVFNQLVRHYQKQQRFIRR